MCTPFFRLSRQTRPILRLLLMAAAILLLAACGEITPTPDSAALEIATVQPSATAAPEVQVAADTSADVADLPQIFADSLGIVLQPGSGTWESVEVLPLTPDLWAAYTSGFRAFDPLKNHAVAIFSQEDGFWIELGRVELECGDYVDSRSIRQVALDQTSIWLAADTGAGAHSGCFDLLRWDGAALTIAVSGFNSSPGAGDVRDVDGDGQPEVVLNATDPYVFCYACGVRLYNISILRWDGTQLLPVELSPLPDDTVADLREANNRAVELAGASLFPAALPLIDAALGYAPSDERVYWNHKLIHALAQGRSDYAGSTPYPLLNWVFYGDWDAAQAELSEYTPAQLFDPQRVLLQETAAAGWEEALADWILAYSGPALAAQPELAPAWFLQGWAHFLKDPSDPAVRTDVEQAARLAPDEALYRASLEQLQARGISQPTATTSAPSPVTVERVRFPVGGTSATLQPILERGKPIGYLLGIGAGQRLLLTVPAGKVDFRLLDPEGKTLSPLTSTARSSEYAIPSTDDYTLVLDGEGAVQVVVEIPPR
jgi:hypothetical protein